MVVVCLFVVAAAVVGVFLLLLLLLGFFLFLFVCLFFDARMPRNFIKRKKVSTMPRVNSIWFCEPGVNR